GCLGGGGLPGGCCGWGCGRLPCGGRGGPPAGTPTPGRRPCAGWAPCPALAAPGGGVAPAGGGGGAAPVAGGGGGPGGGGAGAGGPAGRFDGGVLCPAGRTLPAPAGVTPPWGCDVAIAAAGLADGWVRGTFRAAVRGWVNLPPAGFASACCRCCAACCW